MILFSIVNVNNKIFTYFLIKIPSLNFVISTDFSIPLDSHDHKILAKERFLLVINTYNALFKALIVFVLAFCYYFFNFY